MAQGWPLPWCLMVANSGGTQAPFPTVSLRHLIDAFVLEWSWGLRPPWTWDPRKTWPSCLRAVLATVLLAWPLGAACFEVRWLRLPKTQQLDFYAFLHMLYYQQHIYMGTYCLAYSYSIILGSCNIDMLQRKGFHTPHHN